MRCAAPRKALATLRQQRPPLALRLPQRPGGGADHLLLTELGYLVIIPEVRRGPIELGTWALYLLPILFFAFVQTSSEELLFRGYLQRGLAYRFRSPLAWAVLPTLSSRRCTGTRHPCSA